MSHDHDDNAERYQKHPHGRAHGHKHHDRHHKHGHDTHMGDGERDFWREWRDERHGRGPDIPLGQPLSPAEMEAWRVFFRSTFGTWPEQHWIVGGRRFSPWHQGLDSFNPFVATLMSKGGGLLPLYVLHLIAQQPRYGNEIMDLLATRTNGQWVANPGAIYPLLALLEREGFVTGEWADPERRTVRVYTITASGREEVARIEAIVLPKVEETIAVLQELLIDLQDQSPTSVPDTSAALVDGPGTSERKETP